MPDIVDRCMMIPAGIKAAFRYEWDRDRPGYAFAILGVWNLSIFTLIAAIMIHRA